jgi:hypothetical protein
VTDRKTVLNYIAFGILILAAGVTIGSILGRETAPKNIVNIQRNGTLSAYDLIFLTDQLPDDMTTMIKRQTRDRIVFLWTVGSEHKYLYVMVLEK